MSLEKISKYELRERFPAPAGSHGRCGIAVRQSDGAEFFAKALAFIDYTIDEGAVEELAMRLRDRQSSNALARFAGFSKGNLYNLPNAPTVFYRRYSASLGDVLDAPGDNWGGAWCDTSRAKVLVGVAAALRYLHSAGVVHGDIKAENIMFEKEFEPKVMDYGYSEFFQNGLSLEDLDTRYGAAANYLPPEAFEGEFLRIDAKWDVYAFGVIAYEVLTGARALAGLSAQEKVDRIKAGIEVSLDSGVNENLRNLIVRCVSTNAESRPGFDEIYQVIVDNYQVLLPDIDKEKIEEYIRYINNEIECTSEAKSPQRKIKSKGLKKNNAAEIQRTKFYDELDENEKQIIESAEMGDVRSLILTIVSFCKGENGFPKSVTEAARYAEYALAIDKNNPIVAYIYGIMLYNEYGMKKNYKTARDMFKIAAEAPNAVSKAQIAYACVCEKGIGGVANISDALKYYKLAADNGDIEAKYRYGKLLLTKNDPAKREESINYIKEASENGNKDAQFQLATLYLEEENEDKMNECIKLFNNVIERSDALNNLGYIYQKGYGVPIDLEKAANYYKQSAEMKDSSGMYNYGLVLQYGLGVERNTKLAVEYFKQSAELNNPNGMYQYSYILGNGIEGEEDIEIDHKKSVEYLKKAVDSSNPPAKALSAYGYLLQNGLGGVEKNVNEAIKYYKQAQSKDKTDELSTQQLIKLKISI